MLNRFLRALRGGASPVTPPERSPAAVSAGPLAELPREAVGVGGLDRVLRELGALSRFPP